MNYKKDHTFNLQYYRKNAGLTQKDVADKLKISPQLVSLWEKGSRNPRIEQIGDLAKLFKVSTDSILSILGGSPENLQEGKITEITQIVGQLTSDGQERVLDFSKFELAKEKKPDNKQ